MKAVDSLTADCVKEYGSEEPFKAAILLFLERFGRNFLNAGGDPSVLAKITGAVPSSSIC